MATGRFRPGTPFLLHQSSIPLRPLGTVDRSGGNWHPPYDTGLVIGAGDIVAFMLVIRPFQTRPSAGLPLAILLMWPRGAVAAKPLGKKIDLPLLRRRCELEPSSGRSMAVWVFPQMTFGIGSLPSPAGTVGKTGL
jgi:hypothetical protein